MLNLTKEQKKLLSWMETGRTFQVYADYGKVEHHIAPVSELPVRVFQKTVKKLYQDGLISFEPVDHFGQRWDEFSLTRYGRDVI